ncbi:MAG: DUF3617 domain-containing protein [Burkholderiaceae bacterium]
MRKLLTALTCTAAMGLPGLPAGAQAPMMKAGLWEMKQKPELDARRQAQMDQAQKQLAAMPAEQRQMMEQMMAQQGVKVDLSGGAITIKACISEAQARSNTPPVVDKGRCTHDVQRSGNVIRTHFVCADPASEGDSEVTLKGSDGFTSKTRITHANNGSPETIQVNGDAHWLGSDCGALKPAGGP